jgi:hypothetical protein
MSDGNACGKQAAQYAGKQPDEGSGGTSRDTAAAENEVHSSGHTHRNSMRLKEMSAAKQAGGKGKKKCKHYLRYGTCKYGMGCRFDHPPQLKDTEVGLACALHPIRPGAKKCDFYLKTGSCKFGKTCKFDHPPEMLGVGCDAAYFENKYPVQAVGFAGGQHPIRPGVEKCAFFLKTGSCKFAEMCKFDHTTSLSADAFAAALEAVPAEDWCRTWAAGKTIMLRRTSKRVKEVVDKMRLPAVLRLSRSFWGDARNGTAKAKLQFVMRQLTLMTGWSASPHSRCRAVT